MDIWLFELFELVADSVLGRKKLKSTTAAWLAGLLVIGVVVVVVGIFYWQFGNQQVTG